MTRSGTLRTWIRAPTGFSPSANSCAIDGLADQHDERGLALVVPGQSAARRDPPIGDRRIIGADALDRRRPVLVGIVRLPLLADEIADLRDRRVLAPDRLRVVDRERGGAAEAAAHAPGDDRARQDHDQIGAEAFDLLAHRLVGALADGDHGDQRGDADEDAEHGQRRAHHVAADRLRRGGEDHQRRTPRTVRRESRPLGSPGRSCAALAAPLALRRRRRRRRLGGALVGDDVAVAHRDDAVGVGGDVGFVGDDDDGHALLAVERDQGLHDLVRGAGVEIAGRLVGEQQARRVDQRARDGDALLLAARELARRVALAVAEAEQPQRPARPLDARLAARRPGRRVIKGQADVLDRAGARQQIEALEDEAEALAADAGELRLLEPGDVDAVEEVAPAGRPVEAAEDRHQRRLARSRGAHDGDELAALDRQADAPQRLHLVSPTGKVRVTFSILRISSGIAEPSLASRRASQARQGRSRLGAVRPRSSATMTSSPALRSPLTISVKVSSSSPVVTSTGPACRRAAPRRARPSVSPGDLARPGSGQTAGDVAQRLIGHAQHIVPLVDDDARRRRHARHQREVVVGHADHDVVGHDVLHGLRVTRTWVTVPLNVRLG